MLNRSRRETLALLALGASAVAWPLRAHGDTAALRSWPLATRQRTGIHDVAPAPDGGVWFSAQRSGHLGWFDPASGKVELVALGGGSSPHGVIQGPDKAAWLTDSGQNAIVRVGWPDRAVRAFPLPAGTRYANLNTAAFDGDGDLWFTGQSGFVGKLATRTGTVTVKESPRGTGPYGICTTPAGDVWWCSLAGSFIARIDRATGDSHIVEPPTPRQGARRVWSDSQGRIWVSEWLSGQVSVHDPSARSWKSWKLPGDNPRPYAVYVDGHDKVWLSDFGGNAIFRFDPGSEKFTSFELSSANAAVRQILGWPGEIWGAESGADKLIVIRTN